MAAAIAYSPKHDSERILEIGINARDRESFQDEALSFLDQSIGFTGAFFAGFETGIGFSPPALVTAGMVPGYGDRLITISPRYQREIAPVKDHALKHGGVAVDTQVLGMAARQTLYYDHLVRPAGGGHSLLFFLHLRGRPRGLIMLGREWSRPFREHELDRVRGLGPALSLALASFACSAVPERFALTAREREIVSFLLLGYSNREIACALGSSPNTVRNQLAALFRKADVCTRAELVGRLLGR